MMVIVAFSAGLFVGHYSTVDASGCPKSNAEMVQAGEAIAEAKGEL